MHAQDSEVSKYHRSTDGDPASLNGPHFSRKFSLKSTALVEDLMLHGYCLKTMFQATLNNSSENLFSVCGDNILKSIHREVNIYCDDHQPDWNVVLEVFAPDDFGKVCRLST